MGITIRKEPTLQTSGINFENITFRYFQEDPKPVLENFSMQVKKDKITVLTGPSGCGKSTLFYLAAGLYPENSGFLDRGRVYVDGKDLNEMDALARSLSVRLVFQNADLQFCFPTVAKEIIFSMEAAAVPPEEMPGRLAEALEAVNLKGYEERLIGTLSGGEKQRLSLACQLVSKAKWLLFDEIFAQVDDDQIQTMVKMLADIKEKYQLSYLIIDHHLENWQGIADEYFLLDQGGRLVATPDRTQVFTGQDWNDAGVINTENTYPDRGDLSRRLAANGLDLTHGPSMTELLADLPPQIIEETAREGDRHFLAVRDLSVRYSDQVIFDHLSFDLAKGKIYALMGPSGIGKTSLLKALAAFIPYRGEVIRLDRGKEERLPDGGNTKSPKVPIRQKFRGFFRRQTQQPYSLRYIFQNPQDQFLKETVADELLLSLEGSYAGDKELQKDRAITLLKDNGLWEMRRIAPFQLSEGQQRRLAVITLLSEQAELILCDEPTYAQDYKNTLIIMDLLVQAARDRGSTIIFTTHDRSIAAHYADYLLYMDVDRSRGDEGGQSLCII